MVESNDFSDPRRSTQRWQLRRWQINHCDGQSGGSHTIASLSQWQNHQLQVSVLPHLPTPPPFSPQPSSINQLQTMAFLLSCNNLRDSRVACQTLDSLNMQYIRGAYTWLYYMHNIVTNRFKYNKQKMLRNAIWIIWNVFRSFKLGLWMVLILALHFNILDIPFFWVHVFIHNFTSVHSECVALQDPYCAWDKIAGKCRSHGAPRWLEENYFYQNVATGQHAACPSGECQVKPSPDWPRVPRLTLFCSCRQNQFKGCQRWGAEGLPQRHGLIGFATPEQGSGNHRQYW